MRRFLAPPCLLALLLGTPLLVNAFCLPSSTSCNLVAPPLATRAALQPATYHRRVPLRITAAENSDNSTEDDGYPGREIVRSVFAVIFDVQRVFFDVLAGLLALGLVLNVCGIGYDFSREEGLVIKPLTEFRQDARDQQFVRAASSTVGSEASPLRR